MNEGKSPPPAQPRARIVDPLVNEFDPGDFTAGGGKCNVRFKAEQLAKKCQHRLQLQADLRRLAKEEGEFTEKLMEEVTRLVDNGTLEKEKSYLTSMGVLSVLEAGRGVMLVLTPLSDNCDHFDINSNAKVPTTDGPENYGQHATKKDDGIPF